MLADGRATHVEVSRDLAGGHLLALHQPQDGSSVRVSQTPQRSIQRLLTPRAACLHASGRGGGRLSQEISSVQGNA
jgi:hypothetical protein